MHGLGRRRLRSIARLAALSAIVVTSLSCGFVKDGNEARKAAEACLQERVEEGGLGSDEWYSDLFWKNFDEREWANTKTLVDQAVGDLKSYSLRSVIVEHKMALGRPSGTFVTLVYKTVYEKGKGTETLIMYRPNEREDFFLAGHSFSSPEIKKLVAKGIERVVAPNEKETSTSSR